MNKKELKSKIKGVRERLVELNIISPHVNLQIASEEEMIKWLATTDKLIESAENENESEDVETEITEIDDVDDLSEINKSRTLSQLALAIVNLSKKGSYKDWQFTYWHRNGQARIYAKDISYKNPKERGCYTLKSSGKAIKTEDRRNPLPDLPVFPRDFYHDDVSETREDNPNDIDLKVQRYLEREFPNGWHGQDSDDAYEMFSGR